MYICMLAFMLSLAGYSCLRKEYANVIYVILLCTMTMFLALRFGQGSDYWGYRNLFECMPDTFDFHADVYNSDYFHGEIGWKLLMNFFKVVGMNFETVIILLAFIEMSLVAWSLERYCGDYKVLALLILFPTVYLTYFFSTLRQGFVISVTLSMLLPLLQKRRYIVYVMVVLLLCLIHSSSLLLLLPLFTIKIGLKEYHRLFITTFFFGLLLCITPAWKWIHQFVLAVYPALGEGMVVMISLFALAERILTCGVVMVLFRLVYRDKKPDYEVEIVYKTYLLADFFYFILMGSRTLAGRFCMLFKCVEVILLPMLLMLLEEKYPRYARKAMFCVYGYCMILASSLTIYHLGVCSEEGNYYNYYNAFEYPYISIFHEDMVYELFDTEFFD